MSVKQKYGNAPWLYSETTGDLVGVKDPDGSEFFWSRTRFTGAFYNNTTQSFLSATTPVPVQFDTSVYKIGIELLTPDTITFYRGGLYNFTLTLQVKNADSQIQDFYLWGRLNGNDILGTTTRVSVTESHGGKAGSLVLERTYFARMNALDEIQVMMEASSTLVSLTPVTATATHPAGPSATLAIYEVAD